MDKKEVDDKVVDDKVELIEKISSLDYDKLNELSDKEIDDLVYDVKNSTMLYFLVSLLIDKFSFKILNVNDEEEIEINDKIFRFLSPFMDEMEHIYEDPLRYELPGS
jgi:hypothetical protein